VAVRFRTDAEELLVSLAEATLEKEKWYRIVRIDAVDGHTTRLMELGLVEGTIFKLANIAPFGDPIHIQIRGSSICVRSQEAQHVYIEATD
jgi:Fe2+ transport system protein FeoA